MIQFEIIKSPDQNVLHQYQYFQNQLYLGRISGNVRIEDPELLKSHVMIEVVESNLIIHPQPEVNFYLLNGKRATTVRKLSVGDEITLGATVLKILKFSETPTPSKKAILNQKLSELMEENSPLLTVIEKLGQLSK